jgi:HD-GYP domain-containing protein (c-di-GMP phosphodiesterase class II)
MLRKFAVHELRPGMFVVDSSKSSLTSPFLYSGEGLLESAEEIGEIAGKGYREALVDLERSYKEWAVLYGDATEETLADAGSRQTPTHARADALEPKVELREELPKAVEVYTEAVTETRRLLRSFLNNGELDVKTGISVVENVIESVLRNVNALQAVSKLRSQDDYTFSHCVNVSMLTVMFIRHLDNGEGSLLEAGLAGFFHDLGKIRMPETILNAPRQLTRHEFSIMQRHPQIGHDYLKEIPEFSENIRLAALEHHERANGEGYPQAKNGASISRLGKITAIIDVYDALSSRRVYKKPILPHRVLGIMYGMRDKDLDSELTEHFIRCMGIYPAGSVVRLSSGETGIVTRVNYSSPLRPEVLLVRDEQDRDIIPCRSVDLTGHPELSVKDCPDPDSAGVRPVHILSEYAGMK